MEPGKPITVIEADGRMNWGACFRELVQFRDLFLAFLERDLKVRYRQTVLGVLWVIIQPLFTAGAFTLIFGALGAMPSDGLPYWVFYGLALVPWNTFATALSTAAFSLESGASLISKIYFPRVLAPAAGVAGSLLDFLIAFAAMNLAMIAAGTWRWQVAALALILLPLQALAVLGLGIFFAALNAQYRDVKYAVPFLVQVGLLLSPVIYPLAALPEWARRLMFLNPMAGVIEGYRAAALGASLPWTLILANLAVSLALLAFSLVFFRWRENRLLDVL